MPNTIDVANETHAPRQINGKSAVRFNKSILYYFFVSDIFPYVNK